MLIYEKGRGYSKRKKLIVGKGFVDSLSDIFRDVGSFVSNNKDVIAKPLLGALSTLAAKGITTGIPALLNRMKDRNKNNNITLQPEFKLDEGSKEILRTILPKEEVSNIIGSGVQNSKKKKKGSGIKSF